MGHLDFWYPCLNRKLQLQHSKCDAPDVSIELVKKSNEFDYI